MLTRQDGWPRIALTPADLGTLRQPVTVEGLAAIADEALAGCSLWALVTLCFSESGTSLGVIAVRLERDPLLVIRNIAGYQDAIQGSADALFLGVIGIHYAELDEATLAALATLATRNAVLAPPYVSRAVVEAAGSIHLSEDEWRALATALGVRVVA